MPRIYKRKVGSRSYQNYSQQTLQLCLAAVRSGRMSQRKAEQEFKIPRRTIINKLKGNRNIRPGRPSVFSEEEEASFVNCILGFSEFGFPLDSMDLRMIVKSYLTRIGRNVAQFKNNVPGHEWVLGFLKRHHELTVRFASNIKRSRAGINAKALTEYISNLSEVVRDVPPENIWNCDESNLTDNPGQKKIITKRGCKYPEKIRNSSKSSISLMFAGNAAGEILPPFVVYRSSCMWSTWTENGPKGARYTNTSSGWFDACSFTEWFESLMLPKLKKLEGKKVLICDNLSSHVSVHVLHLCKDNNISFVCLPPNSTHLTQPLDVAFFHPMKVAWRKILSEWKETLEGSKSTVLQKQHFPMLLNKLMTALEPNAAANLISGFRKCGIYPVNVDELLKMIPQHNSDITAVESSFLETLATKRTDLTEMKRTRKKMRIAAGKSIGPEDLDNQETDSNKPQPKNLKNRRKVINVVNDSSSDEISLRDSSDDDAETYFTNMVRESLEDEERNAVASGEKSNKEILQLSEIIREVGKYVIFTYEGELFPGQILSYDNEGAVIKAMQKSLKSWKWPEKPDILNYSWEDIVGGIAEPKQVSKRGYFTVPELNKIW